MDCILTEFKMHACSLDVALAQRRLELRAFVQVFQRVGILTSKIAEGPTHVVGKSVVFSQILQFKGLVKRCGCTLVAVTSLLRESLQPSSELTLSTFFFQICSVLQTFRCWSGSEALQIIGDEGRTWELTLFSF